MKIKTLLSDFISLFYPELCISCECVLSEGEKHLCLDCLLHLPKTNYHLCPDNAAGERLKGKVPYQTASAFLFYNKGGIAQHVVAAIKYKGNSAIGLWISNYLSEEIMPSGYFNDIDWIVPVPLHPKKLKKRGFNQSEIIARGISQATGIPLSIDCLYRRIANPTQTKKGSYERWLNTLDIFAIRSNGIFAGKHILLIDDVLTTGSTIEACAAPILKCKGVKISILTLSIAQ